MSAQNYRDRLMATRCVWTVACVLFTLFVEATPGDRLDFFIVMVIVWGLGFPRNNARRLARRAERQADFLAAAHDELNKMPRN